MKTLGRNSARMACESKSDTSNNRGNWNNLENIQKIFLDFKFSPCSLCIMFSFG